MKRAYQIYTDGIFGGIRYTDEKPNDDDVFQGFKDARRELVRRMQFRADEYRRSAAEFRHLKLADVEEAS